MTHQDSREKRLEAQIAQLQLDVAALEGGAGALFPPDPLGKVTMDWVDSPVITADYEDSGLNIAGLPDGSYSMVQLAGRMITSSIGGVGVGDFQGALIFDDGAGTPDTRFVVGLGEFVGPSLNDMTFNNYNLDADGSLHLSLYNQGDATNHTRLELIVGKPFAVPFTVPGP